MSNPDLEQAIERADLRAIIAELYPDSGANTYHSKQRIKAIWRGGDNPEVVSLNPKTAHDFKTAETYNAWTFLTGPAGFSKQQAAQYLLARTGLADAVQQTPKARRQAAAKTRLAKAQEAQQEAYKAKKLEDAHELQKSAATTGSSEYLMRKGVAEVWSSHQVARAILPTGEGVPGLVYSSDRYGAFMQFALRNLAGTVTGYQRIYDGKVLPGERDKDFIGATKGAFVLLEPLDVKPRKGAMFKSRKQFKQLPKTSEALAGLLDDGYEVAICEGLATSASIACSKPKTFVFCTLSAGNLEPVTEALRERYGYKRKLKSRGGNKLKAIDLCIWADLDESGTGQEKAHQASLKSDCYVRVPKFKHGCGDFNDLHQALGLAAVRRTRRVTPDATLAFAKQLSKQKLSEHKHLAPFDLPDPGAALIVRAPQETGKTHRLAELLDELRLRVLVVTHRESLAKNLAARLRFDCYQDHPAHLLRDIPQLVICFDSLQKLTIGGELPAYDLLVLDESEQVLEHTVGRHIKRKVQNFGVLEKLLSDTPRIICADADAGSLTADTLRRYSPARRIGWHIHEHHIATGRRVRFVQERDDVLDALEREQRPTWYATDSLRHTRDLSAYLNDPNTLTINSETATTDAAAAYLLDPTGQAPAHQRMIASPSVQTGLSDDSGHWKHITASFTGHSSTPQDAQQAVMRARRVAELTIHAAKGRGEALTVEEALEGAAAADNFEAEALARESYGTANPNYERLRAEVEVQRTRRQLNYKERLVLNMARLGYSVRYELYQDLSPEKLEARDERRKALKEAGLERYVNDRVNAERIDDARAKALEDAYTLAQADRFALEQYQLRAFYVMPNDVTDNDLAEMLRQDDYKALRRKVENYECFIEPRAVAEARACGEIDGGVLKGDAKSHMLRFEFHRRLGTVTGLDSASEQETATWQQEKVRLEQELKALRRELKTAQTRRRGELYKRIDVLEADLKTHRTKTLSAGYSAQDSSVKVFVTWCREHYQALKAAGIVTCSLDNLEAKPLEVIGDSVKRCGLKQSRDKKASGRTYALNLEDVSTMCNYSRPRRNKWDFVQQNDIKDLNDRLLHKTGVSASPTRLITDAVNSKQPFGSSSYPDGRAAGWLDTFRGWLEGGQLDDFGPQKLQVIRTKLETDDRVWLHRLAGSPEVYRMVGRA